MLARYTKMVVSGCHTDWSKLQKAAAGQLLTRKLPNCPDHVYLASIAPQLGTRDTCARTTSPDKPANTQAVRNLEKHQKLQSTRLVIDHNPIDLVSAASRQPVIDTL